MQKIVCWIVAVLSITISIIAMEQHPIIVLNGSSCAGKSSIADHLQQQLDLNAMVVSYDKFRGIFFAEHHKALQLLPDDYHYTEVTVFFDDIKKHLSLLNDQEKISKEAEVSNFYKKANMEFYKHINQCAQAGPVIVDTIILSQQQKDMMEKQLNHNVIMVFVHVPFAAITERIKRRNAVSRSEARYANRVLSVYPHFYRLHKDEKNGFNGHISKKEIEATVEQSLSLPYSTEFPVGNILAEKITSAFGLDNNDDQKSAQLVPRLLYNHIIDTSIATSQECALELYNKLGLGSKQ